MTKQDIRGMDDIRLMVDDFYGKVREDALLGPIFDGVIRDRWPEHLDKMYRFWETVLLGERSYMGSPFHPHASLPVHQAHFDRWLALFHETINSHFEGAVAEEAKWRGDKMAALFLGKIEYYRSGSGTPLH